MFLHQWVHPNIGQSIPEIELRQPKCRNYPSCSDNHCLFFHPTIKCRYFHTPTSCVGIFCRFKHPICLNDEKCIDTFCAFEHKLSDPVLLKIYNAKERRMLYDLAISHLSSMLKNELIIEDIPMHRDVDEYPIGNINSSADQPSPQNKTNELNDSGKIRKVKTRKRYLKEIKRIRCYFFPQCEDINCKFAHPHVVCRDDLNCKHGRHCPYLHSRCQDDGKCTNENCPKEHYKQLHPFRLITVTKEVVQRHKEYAKNRLEEMCEDLCLPSFPSFPSEMDISLSCVVLSPDN